MGAPGMLASVVCRLPEGDESGLTMEVYLLEPLGGDVAGVLVTRESDGSERLVCGMALELLMEVYRGAVEGGPRLPDGRVWCDGRAGTDLLATGVLRLFEVEPRPVEVREFGSVVGEVARYEMPGVESDEVGGAGGGDQLGLGGLGVLEDDFDWFGDAGEG